MRSESTVPALRGCLVGWRLTSRAGDPTVDASPALRWASPCPVSRQAEVVRGRWAKRGSRRSPARSRGWGRHPAPESSVESPAIFGRRDGPRAAPTPPFGRPPALAAPQAPQSAVSLLRASGHVPRGSCLRMEYRHHLYPRSQPLACLGPGRTSHGARVLAGTSPRCAFSTSASRMPGMAALRSFSSCARRCLIVS